MIATISTTFSVILSTGSNVVSKTFAVGFSNGTPQNIIQVYSNSANFQPTSGKTINDGLWHSVLVTYDGTTLNIYVDGRLDNTAANWNAGSSSTIASTLNTIDNSGNYLGQYVDGSSYRLIGKLKNVLFYDYAINNSYALANSYQAAGAILYTSGNFL